MRKSVFALALLLGIISQFAFGEIFVGNAGFPGDGTTQGLERIYKDVLSYNPDVVVMMFGTNDIGNPQCILKPAAFEAKLEQLVDKCRTAGVREVVLMTPPPIIESVLRSRSPNLDDILPEGKNINEYLLEFCDAVKSVAKKKNCRLIDLNKAFMDNGGATTDKSCLLRNPANSGANDGTHPTPGGYEFIAATVLPIVKPLLKDGDVIICLGDSITYGSHVSGSGTANGGSYPAKLWRLLNPSADKNARASQVPSESYFPGNMVRNPYLEIGDENGNFPLSWVFWKKGTDTCRWIKGDAHSGEYFVRLNGSADSEAVMRTDMIMINPKREYRFSAFVRGKGKLDFSISLYYPPRPTPISVVELTDKWQKIEGSVNVPGGFGQCSIIFKTRGQVDVDTLKLWPADEPPPQVEAAPAATPPGKLPELHADKVLSADSVTMTFARPEEGAAIMAVKKVSTSDGVIFTNRGVARGLFNIRLKKIAFNPDDFKKVKGLTFDPEQDYGAMGRSNDCESSDDLLIDAMDVIRNGGQARVTQLKNGFRYEFKSIKVGDEADALDVCIDAVKGEDGGIAFTGSFVNRSKLYTVFYFTYPQVEGLGGIHGNAEEDYLAYPMFLGRLIKNPASGKLYKSNMIFRGNNSSHSMHFDALYNNGDGLFFHVKDPMQFAKRWLMFSDPATGFTWSVCHVPNNMRKVPQAWTVPYPVEISTFDGDWYDAARKYRKWAINQYWCAKGTIAQREASGDLRKWFIDRTAWTMIGVKPLTGNDKPKFEAFFKDFSDYKNAVWLINWGHDNNIYDFPNPDRFPMTELDKIAFKTLKDHNIPFSGYIQTTGWSMSKPIFKNTPDAEKCLVRNYYGQILAWGESGSYGDAAIAFPGDPWRKILVQTTGDMVRAGFDSVYMDSGNHGGFYLNFTPEHATSTGGGNDYIRGIQRLLKEVRTEGRKINPDFSITAESFWEGNLNVLDAVLTVNSPNFYLERERVTAIPLAQIVYHDYGICYSTNYARRDMVNTNSEGYVAKTGQQLVWGIKAGWELVHYFFGYHDNYELLRNYAHDRFSAADSAQKFLVYGTMLRCPKVSHTGTNTVKWARGWSDEDYDVTQPDVLTSAWEAPDGSLGIVLYNTTMLPVECDVALNDREYKSAGRSFSAVYPVNKKFTMNPDRSSMHIILPARRFVIIQGK